MTRDELDAATDEQLNHRRPARVGGEGEQQVSDPVHTYCAALTEAAAKVVEQSTMHESDRIVIAVRLRGFQQEYDRLRTALAASQQTVKVLGESLKATRAWVVYISPFAALNSGPAEEASKAYAKVMADPDARRAVEGPKT